MSNQVRFSPGFRSDRANLHADRLTGGSLVIYDAGFGVPEHAGIAITDQVALVTFDLPDPAGDVSDGVFTSASLVAALIDATGTAAFARAYDSGGAGIGDYDVGAVGSGEAVELDNLSMVEGAYATVVSFVVTEG